MSWLLAFVGFALLIILHELGHFAAAKAVGMRVERFSLFFPPTVARKTVGETEYAIGAVPLGGYVKISGMNPAEDLPDEVRTRAYYAQPVWKRIVVIGAGPAVNLVLAFVLLFLFISAVGAQDVTTRVGEIEKDFPAFEKLEPGDRLIAVDGVRGDPERLSRQIQSHRVRGQARGRLPGRHAGDVAGGARRTPPGVEAHARLRRGGGADASRASPTRSTGRAKPCRSADSLDWTADRFWFFTKATVELPARIIDPEQRKDIQGVVGAYETTRQTILNDFADVIGILAIISLSLAIVNLFPFLPLDGGHIFWAVVEKVRRKPVPFSVMERAGVVGFMLVIFIFLIGLTNDIDRLSGEGFNSTR